MQQRTPRRARRAAAVALAVVLSGLSACRSSTAGPLRSSAALSDMLLPDDVLGEDWQVQTRAPATPPLGAPAAIESSFWCSGALEPVAAAEALTGAGGALLEVSEIASGRGVHAVTEQLWSSREATAYFALLTEAIEACAGAVWQNADGQQASLVVLDPLDVGDGSIAVRATVQVDGPDSVYQWVLRVGLVRLDTVVIVLHDLDVQPLGSAARLSEPSWRALAVAAAAPFVAAARP